MRTPIMFAPTTASVSLSIRRTMVSRSGVAIAREARGQASTARTRLLRSVLFLVIRLKPGARVPSVPTVALVSNSLKRRNRTRDVTVLLDSTVVSASTRTTSIPSSRRFQPLRPVLVNPSNLPAPAIPAEECLVLPSLLLSLLPSVPFLLSR